MWYGKYENDYQDHYTPDYSSSINNLRQRVSTLENEMFNLQHPKVIAALNSLCSWDSNKDFEDMTGLPSPSSST